MLEFLQAFLPVIIYILLIVLLVILIIVGLKAIEIFDKVNYITDSVSKKIDTLNGVFHAIDFATDKFNDFTTMIVETIATKIGKIFKSKKKNIEEENEEEI